MRTRTRLAIHGLSAALAIAACRSSNDAGASSSGAPASTSAAEVAASSAASGGAPSTPCPRCGAPAETGSLASAEIDEASGLSASRVHAGVYYVHNDSGDSARFFAIDESGADRGVYDVSGASAIDWEDMTVAPCGGESCILLGDIGDNLAVRSSYVVYRVREPARVAAGEHELSSEALPFEYPDGSHNAETLLSHPDTGELYVLTKVEEGISALYRFPMPLQPGVQATLEKVRDVAPPEGSPKITAGDVHSRGGGVLLRTYSHVWFYPLRGADLGAALAATPCALPAATEVQGETIAWMRAGSGFATVSEGVSSGVHSTACR